VERIAFISDIHGNIPALEAVLSDIKSKGINRIICLGDLVGKGPSSELAVDMIKENCETVLKGNWDYLISEVYDSYFLRWHRSKLRHEHIEYLIKLPMYSEFYISGKLIRAFHSSPNDLFYKVSAYSTFDEKMPLFKISDKYA
jgi:protein phosphatase